MATEPLAASPSAFSQRRRQLGIRHDGEPGPARTHAGLRLRYEVVREFAPYPGVAWRRRDDALSNSTELVWLAGIRFWL